jgi:hypothetical protein|nr:MAG TPA: hypothetical protein [Caudoviricetes sp.]
MNSELIRAVLDCGVDDLRLLDYSEANLFEVVERMRSEGISTTMNNIIKEVFEDGKQVIVDRYEAMLEELKHKQELGIMEDEDCELQEELEKLDPGSDFTFWINLQDTDFNGDNSKQELYEKYFKDELEECERITGYDIKW